MSDTPQTRAALVASLADNDSGQISAQTVRNFLASVPLATDADAHFDTAVSIGSGINYITLGNGNFSLDAEGRMNALAITLSGGAFTVDNSANLTAHQITSDGGTITTDGSGNLSLQNVISSGTVSASGSVIAGEGAAEMYDDGHFNCDSGAISTDGSGNLTAHTLSAAIIAPNTPSSSHFPGNISGSGDMFFALYGTALTMIVIELDAWHSTTGTTLDYPSFTYAQKPAIIGNSTGLTITAWNTVNIALPATVNASGFIILAGR